MHKIPDKLSELIKAAREGGLITVESLAEKIGVTERYLYRIENEHKKPSYDVLFKLIRELGLDSNTIFYPEKNLQTDEYESIMRKLLVCDKRSLLIIKATIEAALESQTKY